MRREEKLNLQEDKKSSNQKVIERPEQNNPNRDEQVELHIKVVNHKKTMPETEKNRNNA